MSVLREETTDTLRARKRNVGRTKVEVAHEKSEESADNALLFPLETAFHRDWQTHCATCSPDTPDASVRIPVFIGNNARDHSSMADEFSPTPSVRSKRWNRSGPCVALTFFPAICVRAAGEGPIKAFQILPLSTP
jgi:hypothetical protein